MTRHDVHPSPKALLKQLDDLIASVRDEAQTHRHSWPAVQHSFDASASNLAAWLALRRRDLRPLQQCLMALGLSSLGHREGRVLEALSAVRESLASLAQERLGSRPSVEEFFAGQERLRARTEQLFGAVNLMIHRNPSAATSLVFRLAFGSVCVLPGICQAFGDEGHEVVALVARTQMTPQAIAEADRLLALDDRAFKMRDGGMTSDSWARQATWADYYRTSQTTSGALPNQIHSYAWHFVDIELQGGSLEAACFAFPKPAPGTLASEGPDPDCVVNKIEQFKTELAGAATPDAEKLLALKFLMHFIGDLHQPLHATDNLDRGGNNESATAFGSTAALHSHWDTTFVEQIGATTGTSVLDAQAVASALRKPTTIEVAQWLGPADPRNWALESYALAQNYVYGPLPAATVTNGKTTYALSPTYVKNAVAVTSDQLLRAGYRLAAVLNDALAR